MCLMVYIASDQPLPLIEWSENAPTFWVGELGEYDEPVRKQFTKAYVYYLGSHKGCGCGFSYSAWNEEDYQGVPSEVYKSWVNDEEARRKSIRSLSAYLDAAISTGTLQLFACWDGDQTAQSEDQEIVSPKYFGGESFRFREKVLFYVQREAVSTNK
jgi:hypothetical protein